MFHWPEQVTWPCLCSPGLGRIILLQGGSVKGGTLNMGEQYYCLPHLVCSLCGHPDSTWAPRGTFPWEQIWLFPFPYEGFQGDPIPDQTKFKPSAWPSEPWPLPTWPAPLILSSTYSFVHKHSPSTDHYAKCWVWKCIQDPSMSPLRGRTTSCSYLMTPSSSSQPSAS